MRKLLAVFIVAICFTLMLGFAVYIENDLLILHPEEQHKIKEGKSFWEWYSPHGPLNVHYIEKGEGDNHLVLLHGFRARTYTWEKLIDPLADAGYHVWAIDFVGYGLSDKPSDAPYTFDFFLDQIDAFMESMEIPHAHITGHSMGGGLALNMAFTYPHRVKSLTLISALGYPLKMPMHLSIARHIHPIWKPFLVPSHIRRCLKNIVYDEKNITDEQVHAYSLPYQLPGGIAATLATLRQFDNQRLLEMEQNYPSLNFPVSIIWGEHDQLLPLDHYKKFTRDFALGRFLLLNDCGHIPQEEKPEEVLAELLDFFQQVDRH